MKKGALLVTVFIFIQTFCFGSRTPVKNDSGGKSVYQVRLQKAGLTILRMNVKYDKSIETVNRVSIRRCRE